MNNMLYSAFCSKLGYYFARKAWDSLKKKQDSLLQINVSAYQYHANIASARYEHRVG
jgi:hypothetical protein